MAKSREDYLEMGRMLGAQGIIIEPDMAPSGGWQKSAFDQGYGLGKLDYDGRQAQAKAEALAETMTSVHKPSKHEFVFTPTLSQKAGDGSYKTKRQRDAAKKSDAIVARCRTRIANQIEFQKLRIVNRRDSKYSLRDVFKGR